MESIRNSMDPKAKEKHEEEHEDSKKEEKPEQPIIVLRITRLPAQYESNQAELKVVMKNNVRKTYE
jgi:CO dehydrogenase/acetyl-CoA synthase beta subunit